MGLSEWWKRVTGGSSESEETGLSEESEERYDQYQSEKADQFVEQRDPGTIGMVNDEFKQDRY
jgi:predicted GIY-YIG superfamily endonuclease